MTEEQFGWRIEKACADALRVLDTSDLHFLREARAQQLKQGGTLDLFNEVALREIASIFCSGTPTVATPIAAESMNGTIDWGCPLHADPAGLARTAVEVYTQPKLRERVQQQGARIVKEPFIAREWKSRLIERMKSMNTDSRQNYFIGRMLRHHQQRRTEYMSRWIESKNRLNEA